MTHSTSSVILSIRIPPEMRDQLDDLSDATGRTKTFLAAEAIEGYLDVQLWQINAIRKSLKKANTTRTKFIEHSEVHDWVHSWGNKNEKDMPK